MRFVRRARSLVAYWDGPEFIVHNFRRGVVLRSDPLLPGVLSLCEDWIAVDRLLVVASSTGLVTRDVVTALVEMSVLEAADEIPAEADGGWGPWSPIAEFFHAATSDPPPVTGERLESLERARLAAWADRPAPLKTYPSSRRVVLPRPESSHELADVLRRRRTWRRFGDQPVAVDAVAEILDLTFAVQWWGEVGAGLPVPFKTSPSGGACHPIEAYLVAQRVTGLEPGVYHYRGDTHELECLRESLDAVDVVALLRGQWWYGHAAATVFMTAVLPRKQWRYPSPRAYRSILLEAGHFCQTFCLLATRLGLAPFCTGMFMDRQVNDLLGLDGRTETAIYVAGVGMPAGEALWSPADQWPAHAPGRPFAPPDEV